MAWAPCAILAAGALWAAQTVAAQQPQAASSPSAPAAKKSPSHRTRPSENQVVAPAEQAAPTASLPEPPHWPVNDSPNKPSVTWDASGLKIQANNSSLHDILNEVSTDTGAKLEGMGTDERVFGEYGPGAARDVISQVLHGSSYNVLMIGDQGAGTPRQIVLSTRHSGPTPSQANRQTPQDQPDEDVPDQPEVDEQAAHAAPDDQWPAVDAAARTSGGAAHAAADAAGTAAAAATDATDQNNNSNNRTELWRAANYSKPPTTLVGGGGLRCRWASSTVTRTREPAAQD